MISKSHHIGTIALFLTLGVILFMPDTHHAQQIIHFQDQYMIVADGDTLQQDEIQQLEHDRIEIFFNLLPSLEAEFSHDELDIIAEFVSGVQRRRAVHEVETLHKYRAMVREYNQQFVMQYDMITSEGFLGHYAFASENWNTIRNPAGGGSIDISDPQELIITGPDESDGATALNVENTIDYVITVPESGILQFDWEYSTDDIATADRGLYVINGTEFLLSDGSIIPDDPTSVDPLNVEAGDEIGFRVWSEDGRFGPGILTITNFQVIAPTFDLQSIDFGILKQNENPVKTLNLFNNGSVDITITSISSPAEVSDNLSPSVPIAAGNDLDIEFTFNPDGVNPNFSDIITINYDAGGNSYNEVFGLTASVISNNTFVFEFDNLTLKSGEFELISENGFALGGISGAITFMIPDFEHTEELDDSFITDLTILFTSEPDINSDVIFQMGGDEFTSYNAAVRKNWDEIDAPGDVDRAVIPVEIDPAIFPDGLSIWVGNGFENSGNPTGTWSGRVAFFDAEILDSVSFTNNRITEEGWYIFSSPKVYTTIDELTTGLWTQCFTGATFNEAPFCNDIPSGQPTRSNVIQYNGQANAWESASSASSLIPPATSIAVYAYNTQDPTGSGAPTNFSEFDIALNGFPFQNQFTVQIPENEFILLGNPYNDVINLGQATGSDFQNVTGVVWRFNKDAVGSFDIYDINDSNGSFEIQPFEGFFVLSNGSNSTFTFDPSWSGAPKQQPIADEPAFIELYLENEYVSASTSFRAVEDAGPHRPGAHYLRPPAQHQITLYSHYEDNAMMIRYLPTDLAEDIYIPVSIESRYEGTVNLRADFTETVPENWDVILTDTFTGNNYNLRSSNNPGIAISPDEEPVQRFQLHISPNREGIAGSDLPTDFALKQNYPNPFNPSTTIEYMLPEPADVRLEVYSVDGRLIHTLQNGNLNAGRHQITFDASNLASGLYIYRLQAGEVQLIRRMTLLK